MTAFMDKPLDDMEPRDVAIGYAEIFDSLAKRFAEEGDSEWEFEMVRAAGILRGWAKFGTWYTRADLRAVARQALYIALAPTGSVDYAAADAAVSAYLKKGEKGGGQ